MDKDKEFLGTEKIGKLLFRLAVPTVIAQIVNMLYNIVDRIYIGHIPGEGSAALTGVGVCMPIIMIISAFAALVSAGGAPRASISLGKGDKDGAEKILGGCFLLQLILSVLLTAVLLIWDRKLLLMFGASENTIDYAVAYMDIYAVGTIFVQLTLGLNAFITAQGFAKTGMLTVIIGAAANIVLDPLFIFVFDMGVRGAAVATVISQGVSCVWAVCFLLSKKTGLKIRLKNMRLSPKIIMPCIALGLATFIMQASESVISVCFKIRRRYSGRRHDNTNKRNAVCNASLTGHRAGCPAYNELQLRRAKSGLCKKDLPSFAYCQYDLRRYFMGGGHHISQGICRNFQFRFGACRVCSKGTQNLLRRDVPYGRADSLPDGVCVNRQCSVLYNSSRCAQIRFADTAYLYNAAYNIR